MVENWLSTTLYILATFIVVNPQKIPPGVNPNQYQAQQIPQQQYQQPPPPPPQQYQPQPIQSAVPHDMAGGPPPMAGAPPPGTGHQHHEPPPAHGQAHDHHGQPQLLNTANLAEEREHMQEHLNVNIDTSKMSEQELQFHYFKMHDADNNNKLDGCELIKSLIHWHEEEEKTAEPVVQTDEELASSVDQLLQTLDVNFDGYIDWFEYQVQIKD